MLESLLFCKKISHHTLLDGTNTMIILEMKDTTTRCRNLSLCIHTNTSLQFEIQVLLIHQAHYKIPTEWQHVAEFSLHMRSSPAGRALTWRCRLLWWQERKSFLISRGRNLFFNHYSIEILNFKRHNSVWECTTMDKEMGYLMMHSTHFIYGYRHMVKDHSDNERKPAATTWATLSN